MPLLDQSPFELWRRFCRALYSITCTTPTRRSRAWSRSSKLPLSMVFPVHWISLSSCVRGAIDSVYDRGLARREVLALAALPDPPEQCVVLYVVEEAEIEIREVRRTAADVP